ncbi:MAG: hypothetical protein ACRCXZ_06090 [Patescibacteria group bacterium]
MSQFKKAFKKNTFYTKSNTSSNIQSNSSSIEAQSPDPTTKAIVEIPDVHKPSIEPTVGEVNSNFNEDLEIKKAFSSEVEVNENTNSDRIENKIIKEKVIESKKLIHDLENEAISEKPKSNIFKNFSTPKLKKVVIGIGIGAFLLMPLLVLISYLYTIPSPELLKESFDLTSKDGLLVASKPFYASIKGQNTYSQFKNDRYSINLGRVEEKNEILIGGWSKLGPLTFDGLNKRKYVLEKDYTPIGLSSEIKKFYDDKIAKIQFNLKSEEKDFKIYLNNELFFNTASPNQKCTYTKSLVECSLEFQNNETIKNIKFDLEDNSGNKSNVFDSTIELVKAVTLECNEKLIKDEGKIVCMPNFDGEVTIKDQKIPVKTGIQFEVPSILNDGKQQIDINIISNKFINKKISYEVEVNKQLLDIEFNTVVDDKNSSSSKPLIILQGTTSTNANLVYTGSYVEDKNLAKTFINSGITTQFDQKQKTIVVTSVYDEEKKENYTYKFRFTNTAGRIVNYSCIRNFNSKEFKCIKN